MRILAVTQNITVDGSVEMLADWFGPQGQGGAGNADLLGELHRQDRGADGFLVGRRTFEDLRGYWPQLTDDPTGIADYLDRVQKYVVSATVTDPQWQNTTIIASDPIGRTRALKEQPDRDIVTTGSITLCHALIEAGLVDEYRLFVYPVVQGRGRRLLPDGFEVSRLTLLDAKTFRNGITYSRYAVRGAGPVSRRCLTIDKNDVPIFGNDILFGICAAGGGGEWTWVPRATHSSPAGPAASAGASSRRSPTPACASRSPTST